MAELNLDVIEVIHNKAARRFEAHLDAHYAFVSYGRLNGTIVLDHTEVPTALEGHGLAGKLVKTALDYARSADLKVVPACPYVADYIRKNPEYQALLSAATLNRLLAK